MALDALKNPQGEQARNNTIFKIPKNVVDGDMTPLSALRLPQKLSNSKKKTRL